MRFFDIVLGAATIASALAAPTGDSEPAKVSKRKSKFQFTGVNESGAEFGNKNLPGRLDKDYTWPSKSAIDVSFEPVDQGLMAKEYPRLRDKPVLTNLVSLGADHDWQGLQYLPRANHDVGAAHGSWKALLRPRKLTWHVGSG